MDQKKSCKNIKLLKFTLKMVGGDEGNEIHKNSLKDSAPQKCHLRLCILHLNSYILTDIFKDENDGDGVNELEG